jgi:O-antigen/teichoic acid export membrane protein
VVLWVGSAQYEGLFYTIVLSFYMIVVTIGSFNENVLIVLGTIKWYSRMQIVVTIVGILLTIVCGYFFSLKGIVLANLCVLTPVVIYVFSRLIKQLQIQKRLAEALPSIKYVIAISAAAILIYFGEMFIHGKLNTIILLISTGAFFALIMWFTGVDKNQRIQTLKVIRRK